MDVLVVGAKGMLGSDLVSECVKRGWRVSAVDVDTFDITDPVAVAGIVEGRFGKPGWCFNCAAYTAVDKAESERDLAMLINGIAPGYLSQACEMAGVRLLHVSTDFVFDGEGSSPYREQAATNPTGAYGESKLLGEKAVFAASSNAIVARTAWLYGPHGNSFPKTMIKAWLAGKTLRVVGDQFGTPTYTADLARVLCDLASLGPESGVYHTAGPDIVSWHEVAVRAIQTYSAAFLDNGASVEIEAIKTEDWPTPTRRPQFSALSFEKVAELGIMPMRGLDGALKEFVSRLGPVT